MKLPEKPPILSSLSLDWLTEKVFKSFFELFKSNQEYLYWSDFKYKKMPQDLSPENAWFLLKTLRSASTRDFFWLRDLKGDQFHYVLTPKIYQYLQQIDRKFSTFSILDQANPSLFKAHFQNVNLMEESISSSMLEGASTTIDQAKEMLQSGRKPLTPSEQMVVNNYRAMQKIKEFRHHELTVEMLNEIQRILVENSIEKADAAGRFRNENEKIYIGDTLDGTVAYQPPPANLLEQRVNTLLQFANTPQDQDVLGAVHPLIKAIILHFWLAYEHPYFDGNGRTARALFYWSILRDEYPIFEYISLSKILLRAPIQYSKVFLYTEYDDNDLTYFIDHNLQAIIQALQDLQQFVQEKKEEYFKLVENLRFRSDLNVRQQMLLQNALKNPQTIYVVKEHQNYWKVAYRTAYLDLTELAEKGLFEVIKQKKKMLFKAVENLEQKVQRT